MIILNGKFNSAKVFTDDIDSATISEIIAMCNNEVLKESKIRIMPDTHAGMGCTIGTSMTLHDTVIPSMVGIDIGCGMLTIKLKEESIDLPSLDSIIKEIVPCGRERHIGKKSTAELDEILGRLNCRKSVYLDKAYNNIGTLGGGNHFIEIDKDDEGGLYLVIHSGSRHLGIEVEKYYRLAAYKELVKSSGNIMVQECKEKYSGKQLENSIKEGHRLNATKLMPLKGESPCRGELFNLYIQDMKLTQQYAMMNRREIATAILNGANLKADETCVIDTIHNYIDTDNMILRKGAVSAQLNERLLIPINMRDGSLLCVGKGNPDWNYSAPHGAGRLMSRSEAKSSLSVAQFKDTMEKAGVFSTTVNESTLDECPMAYKSMESIISNIEDTVSIEKIIRPIYNFKASIDE